MSMHHHAWVRVCALQDLPVLGARVLEVDGLPAIAIFRTVSDQVFALRDRCPHKGGPLSQGIVAGDTVTCPLHGWAIGLQSGQACAPDVGCAPRYPIKVEAEAVWIVLQPVEQDDAVTEPAT
ncbi:nitrite reductase small subunit NirD [Xanthomonas prunicola]|jgi:nitrite reductase (NADH) small subunit|nr:nitrite reductase small subunit NirD [Xanthomonas prunicola]